MINKFITLLIVVAPIINCYSLPGINNVGLASVIFIIITPVMLLLTNKKIKVNAYLAYYLYVIFISLFAILNISEFEYLSITMRFMNFSLYFLIILYLGYNFFDMQLGTKYYQYACIIASVGLILQYIFHNIFFYDLYFWSNFLPLNYSSDIAEAYTLSEMRTNFAVFRPSSFFMEPSHYAQYVLPCFVLSLLSEKITNSKLRKLAISTIFFGVLLSTSLNGLIVLIISILLFLCKNIGSKKVFIYSGLILALCMVAFSFLDFDYFNGIIGRLGSLGNEELNSVNIRLLAGYFLFLDFNFINQIFGCSPFLLREYLNNLGSYFYMYYDSTYMNSVAYLLCTTGVVGSSIFYYWLFKYFKGKSFLAKSLIIVLFLDLLTASIFNSFTYVLIIALIIGVSGEDTMSDSQIKRIEVAQ